MALQALDRLGEGGSGIPDVMPAALKELQGLKLAIVTGASADTDIALAGIKLTDTIIAALNLTDLATPTYAGVKASKAFTGTTKYDGTLEAHSVGVGGNLISVAFVGDSPGSGGVTISRATNAFTVHYESGVSTVANINTAVGALAGGDDLIAVKANGTTARVLTAPGGDAVAAFLAGGIDAAPELPTVHSAGQIRFATVDTGSKKLLIAYFQK